MIKIQNQNTKTTFEKKNLLIIIISFHFYMLVFFVELEYQFSVYLWNLFSIFSLSPNERFVLSINQLATSWLLIERRGMSDILFGQKTNHSHSSDEHAHTHTWVISSDQSILVDLCLLVLTIYRQRKIRPFIVVFQYWISFYYLDCLFVIYHIFDY